MIMTIEFLKEVVKFLEKEEIPFNKERSSFYGPCVRKAFTESAWDSDYDIINVDVTDEKLKEKFPKVYNKYNGYLLGYRVLIDEHPVIIRNLAKSHSIDGMIGNDVSILMSDLLEDKLTFPKKNRSKEEIIHEHNSLDYWPQNGYNSRAEILELILDGYFNDLKKLKSTVISIDLRQMGYQEDASYLSNKLISILDRVDFIDYYDILFKHHNIDSEVVRNTMKDVLKSFDRNYRYSERIIPRILILFFFLKFDESGADDFITYELKLKLKFKNKIKKLTTILKKVEKYYNRGEILDTIFRMVKRMFNQYKDILEDSDIEEYLIPVIYSMYYSFEIEHTTDSFLEKYQNIMYKEMPINGKDIINKYPNSDKYRIRGIKEEFNIIFDRVPNLTKVELLNRLYI